MQPRSPQSPRWCHHHSVEQVEGPLGDQPGGGGGGGGGGSE